MFRKILQIRKRHQFTYSLLIMLGVICVWRGVWSLLDTYLIPGQPIWSYLISIIFGVVILAVTHYKLSD